VSFSYESPLRDREVELRVTHCGLCHSDIHMRDDDWSLSSYPLVPGHEAIGNIGESPSAALQVCGAMHVLAVACIAEPLLSITLLRSAVVH
jgi:D-arabinose 1-dehydrogenase-like Zn-dependent alcohol dehydrogenase